jgi:hypothetical protein
MNELSPSNHEQELFFTKMGPDVAQGLHQQRPYFLLPLRTGAQLRIGASPTERKNRPDHTQADLLQAAREDAIDRILNWSDAYVAEDGKKITDVYVISHGWHRNFYSAIASYDRLVTRLSLLLHRRRITVANPDYKPLFLTLHWSSEIGVDGWVDFAGRRHKPSFIENAAQFWNDGKPEFQNVMEDVFELFSSISAPDTVANDRYLVEKSELLAEELFKLDLHPALAASRFTNQEKVALAWRCYHEATAKGVHVPQDVKPKPFASAPVRLEIVFKFLMGAGLILTILAKLFPILKKLYAWTTAPLDRWWHETVNPGIGWIAYPLIALGFFGIALAILAISGHKSRKHREKGDTFGVGWLTFIAWAYAQVVCTLPLLLLLVLLYIFPVIAGATDLFAEKKRNRSEDRLRLHDILTEFARWPNRLVAGALQPDSLISKASTAVESQVAFFQMQDRGVDAGEEAGAAIAELWRELPLAESACLHFFGHSFGGLVVANTVRNLSLREQPVPVQTLCLIEGAFASGWFEGETALLNNVKGSIASFFSGYDTATGFYYPLANAGRLSLGSVGISSFRAGQQWSAYDSELDKVPCEAGCKCSHIHRPRAFASLADPPQLPGPMGALSILNLDASRMVYEGPVVSGGAHTDIYKDDVINLLWAVAHRKSFYAPTTGPAVLAPAVAPLSPRDAKDNAHLPTAEVAEP